MIIIRVRHTADKILEAPSANAVGQSLKVCCPVYHAGLLSL